MIHSVVASRGTSPPTRWRRAGCRPGSAAAGRTRSFCSDSSPSMSATGAGASPPPAWSAPGPARSSRLAADRGGGGALPPGSGPHPTPPPRMHRVGLGGRSRDTLHRQPLLDWRSAPVSQHAGGNRHHVVESSARMHPHLNLQQL